MSDEFPQSDLLEGTCHPRHTLAVLGHDKAEAQFMSAFHSDRLHHAWMITGPKGIGKATFAWRLAKFILSLPETDGGMFAEEPPAPSSKITLDEKR